MNPEDCRKHVLNNSGAKYAYKFGNSTRFKSPRLYFFCNARHTHSMYSIDDRKLNKGCGFGYGERPSIGKKN